MQESHQRRGQVHARHGFHEQKLPLWIDLQEYRFVTTEFEVKNTHSQLEQFEEVVHAPLSLCVEVEWPSIRVQAGTPVKGGRLDCHGVHVTGTEETQMAIARNVLLKNSRAQTYRRIIEQVVRLHFQRE